MNRFLIRALLPTAPLFRLAARIMRRLDGNARRLTPLEVGALGMFSPTVPLGDIWLVENSWFADRVRSFSFMGTIFIPARIDIRNRVDVLVHEVAHVWHAQMYGPYYLLECSIHLFRCWLNDANPYDVDISLGFPAGGPLEHQAKFLQEVYVRAAEKALRAG